MIFCDPTNSTSKGPTHGPGPARREAVRRALLQPLSEKQIAQQLGCSPHTVHDHVKAIYRDAGVNSRVEYVAAELARLSFRLQQTERQLQRLRSKRRRQRKASSPLL